MAGRMKVKTSLSSSAALDLRAHHCHVRRVRSTKTPRFASLRGPKLLVAWREKVDRTQRDIAAELDMDASRYCAIEKARNRPGLDHAVAIERLTDGKVKPSDWATIPDDK